MVACQKLRQQKADRKKAEQGVGTEWLSAPIADLADANFLGEWLDDILARKKPATHRGYRYRLLKALQVIGPKTKVADIGKLHLAKIEQKMAGKYSPTTIRDTIATLQAVFSWAISYDLLTENPLVGYKKPRGLARTRIITPDEFQTLLRYSSPGNRTPYEFAASSRLPKQP